MNRAVYRHILRTYGRNPQIWLGYFAILIETFVVRVYVVIVMAQVASAIAAGDTDSAKLHTLYYLVAYIGGFIIGTLGQLLSIHADNAVYEKLMIAYHKKLIGKDMSFYRDNQTGYLASVFRQYLDSAHQLTRFWRGEAMGTVLSLTVPLVVLWVAAPKVGAVAAMVVVVQVAYIAWASAKANQYRALSHEIYRKITGEVSDEVTNIMAFKSSGAEAESNKIMRALAEQEKQTFWFRRKTTTLLDFPRGIITAFGTALAVYFVINGSNAHDPKSLGLIVLTLTYMFQIVRNVAGLPALLETHDELVTKIAPTLRYLSAEYETIQDPASPVQLHIVKGGIDISHVQFKYPAHAENGRHIEVFRDLNLKVSGGEQVGVVGLSGAGKSTLANLLLRFDEVNGGSISIDGIDIRDVKQSDLRKNIAYVPQEPLLFHRSVRENIAYYDETATEKQIIEAAKAAHADEFIRKLPDGYDTIVGERGVKLSGGQKQRVAIARAVLKKAPIMIFDEATSALDSESEQIIQRALPEILGKQTALIVAHRLSTVAGLDRIIVMHDGKIVEEGTHAQLLKLKGRYYSLWQKQTSGTAKQDSR